jgi:membrane protein
VFSKSWKLTRQTFAQFFDDSILLHCAALSYYALFSLAPILIISIAISGFFFGVQASRGEIYTTVRSLFGDAGAHAVEGMVHSAARNHHSGVIATWVGLGTLLFGATGVFSQLEQSLNLIWKVKPAPGRTISNFIHQRLLSFSMVLVIGFLLLISLVASAVLSAVGEFLGSRLPGGAIFWHVANFGLSFAIITLLFAAIFKILPDVQLSWRDVTPGAVVTALLFNVGKLLIGLYLGKSTITSSYGAAGSVIIVLLWVFYSSVIIFFGAEFTRAQVCGRKEQVLPKPGSEFMDQAA